MHYPMSSVVPAAMGQSDHSPLAIGTTIPARLQPVSSKGPANSAKPTTSRLSTVMCNVSSGEREMLRRGGCEKLRPDGRGRLRRPGGHGGPPLHRFHATVAPRWGMSTQHDDGWGGRT